MKVLSVKATEDQYIVRSYREGDEAQIVEILKKSLPEWTTIKDTLEYWNWKYKANPNGFECFVISLNDKILGASHINNIRMKIGNKMIDANCGSEDAIHPDYRGKGLYSKLRDSLEHLRSKHKKVGYWSTRNPIMIDYAARQGRSPVPFKISKMQRIKNIQKHLENNPSNKPWSYPALFLMKTINSIQARKPANEGIEISRIERFDQKINDFCGKIHEHYLLTIEKNESYLNWRYSNPEADEVLVLQAVKDQEIVGFCAVEIKESPRGLLEAHVLDLLCLPSDQSSPYLLLNRMLALLDEIEVNDVHFRVSDAHPYRLIAERCGFMDFTRWSKMKFYINERKAHEYFKKNIKEIASFPEELVYFSHGDMI